MTIAKLIDHIKNSKNKLEGIPGLWYYDNDKNIKCLSFGNSKGLAYLPKISKDIVYSQHESETKIVNACIEDL